MALMGPMTSAAFVFVSWRHCFIHGSIVMLQRVHRRNEFTAVGAECRSFSPFGNEKGLIPNDWIRRIKRLIQSFDFMPIRMILHRFTTEAGVSHQNDFSLHINHQVQLVLLFLMCHGVWRQLQSSAARICHSWGKGT